MADVVTRYRTATEAGDVDAVERLLEPDAELISPISGRMVFRGKDDLGLLFTAVYGTLKDLRWHQEVGDDRLWLLRGEARLGPFRIGDAMILELSPRGRIQRIRPHFRPWLGLTAFALVLGPKPPVTRESSSERFAAPPPADDSCPAGMRKLADRALA